MTRFASYDVASETDAELLAHLVGHNLAVALAKKPLAEVFGFASIKSQNSLFDESAQYVLHPAIGAAKELMSRCMLEQMQSGDALGSPAATKAFLCARLSHLEYEAFWCLWLNAQNCVIEVDEAFRGTLTQTAVYPREIVKRALAVNARGLICAHNHPSGTPEPSPDDLGLTKQISAALALVDVRLLDHMIVGGTNTTSLAERGLI
jgi:DNA repair protein RadC